MAAKDNKDIGLVELRRGALVLATLSQLRTRQYGYSLRQSLAEGGLPIEEGTLYPLLRRLESDSPSTGLSLVAAAKKPIP